MNNYNCYICNKSTNAIHDDLNNTNGIHSFHTFNPLNLIDIPDFAGELVIELEPPFDGEAFY